MPGSGAANPGNSAGQANSASESPSTNAGHGTAGFRNGDKGRLSAGREETVDAKVGSEGSSELTTLDRRDRPEAGERASRDVAMDFLKVQEEALARDPLPLSRREHVLRYFTALRKQIEGRTPSGSETPPAASGAGETGK